MGNSLIKLQIENKTNSPLIASASEIDIFDFNFFSPDGRPKETLQDISILPGKAIEKQVDLNALASKSPITINLNYSDGSADVFRINLQWARDKSDDGFCRLREDHHLSYRLEENKIIVTVKSTPEQSDEQHAKDLMSEAELLIQCGKFDEALIKLESCQKKTYSYDVSRKIQEMIDKVRQSNLERGYERNAEVMLSQIDDLISEGNYEIALSTLRIIERQLSLNSTLLKKVDDYKAKIRNHQGETLIQKALEAENDSDTDRSEEALKYYQEARDLFEEANRILPSWDFRRNLAQVENKIEGDKLFKYAIELDIKALELLESNNYEEAEEQFSLILTVLNDAKNKFQESGEIGQQGIDDVQDFQKLIEERGFELALSKIQFKSKTNDNEMNYQEDFKAEMIL